MALANIREVQKMVATTNNVFLIKQHFIGKICFSLGCNVEDIIEYKELK